MLRTVKGVEVNISGRTFSSRSFCHQSSALALSKKCPALTISYRPELICKKRHGLDIHYSAAERSLGSHRRRRLRASSFPMPLTSETQDTTRFPPHITKPLCVKWLFLDALSGAGVPAWGVGLGVARGDLAEEPVFRM